MSLASVGNCAGASMLWGNGSHRRRSVLSATRTLGADATVPLLIQGGMGVAVSNYRLARAVAMTGHLGVVSGTAIDLVLVRRLQDGDGDGEMRNAMAQFPLPAIADQVLQRYFLPGGRRA